MNRYGTPDIYRTLYHHAAMMSGRADVGAKQPPERRLRGPGKALSAKGLRTSALNLIIIETPYVIVSPEIAPENIITYAIMALKNAPVCGMMYVPPNTKQHEREAYPV